MSRIAGIDFGLARIGISVSDELKLFATPKPFLRAGKTLDETAGQVWKFLSSQGTIDKIVVGFPLLLNGKEGDMAEHVKRFVDALKIYFKGDIVLWDERLTTAQVERTLKEAEFTRKQRSQLIDSASAAALLQNFLDLKSCLP